MIPDPFEPPPPSNPGAGGWTGPEPVGRVMYAVDLSNNFLVFGSESMNALTAKMRIRGLPILKRIIGIALRPSDGKLYGVGTDSRVYVIDPLTAEAVPVSNQQFSPKIFDAFDIHFAMDLEPETERVRLIAVESGANWSISLDDGTAVPGPKAIYGAGTPLEGRTPRLLGLIYPTLPDSAKGPGWCANLAYAIDADEAIMLASCDPATGEWWPTGAPPETSLAVSSSGRPGEALPNASLTASVPKAIAELKDDLMRCGEFMASPNGSTSPGERAPSGDPRLFPSTPPTEFYMFLVELGTAMNRAGVVKPIDTDRFVPGITIQWEIPSSEPIQSVEWVPHEYVPSPALAGPTWPVLQQQVTAGREDQDGPDRGRSLDPRASCR